VQPAFTLARVAFSPGRDPRFFFQFQQPHSHGDPSMKTIKALVTTGILVAATAAAAAYTFPFTSAQTPIDRQISSIAAGFNNGGFDRLVFDHRAEMETRGREVQFVVLLQAGADYRLAARCGTDCVNLNLSIRDAAGRELGTGGGDVPGFDFRAPHSGAYVVTLDLASCRTPRCNVGAVVLGRSTQSPDA
jgi:hypothetical protein